MKATLSFDLDNSEDSVKHLRAVKSLDLAIAINDILQLRKKLDRRFENTNKLFEKPKKVDFEITDFNYDNIIKEIHDRLQ